MPADKKNDSDVSAGVTKITILNDLPSHSGIYSIQYTVVQVNVQCIYAYKYIYIYPCMHAYVHILPCTSN